MSCRLKRVLSHLERLNLRTFGLHFYCLHHKSSFSEFHLHSYRRDCQDTCRDFRSFAISAKSIYPFKESCSWNVVCVFYVKLTSLIELRHSQDMASVKNVWTRMSKPQDLFIKKPVVVHVGRSLAITSHTLYSLLSRSTRWRKELTTL